MEQWLRKNYNKNFNVYLLCGTKLSGVISDVTSEVLTLAEQSKVKYSKNFPQSMKSSGKNYYINIKAISYLEPANISDATGKTFCEYTDIPDE